MKQWFGSLMVFAAVMVPTADSYAQVDPLIEGAKMCTRHLTRYERQYGIPTHLLSAISTVESGRLHKGLKIRVPWPWAVNVEGQGYMFDSKEEAMAAVRKFRSQGARSIDVGCMQVNLVHHAKAFASLEKAFDPETNIAYAASFLRSLYEVEGSWKEAAADYHSKTPARGSKYAGLVYNSWYQIIDKVRNARLQADSTSSVASAEPATTSTKAIVSKPMTLVSGNESAPRPVTPVVRQASTVVANYAPSTSERTREISVSHAAKPARISVRNYASARSGSATDHENDVLVVNTPAPASSSAKTILVAEAHDIPAPKVIQIDSKSAPAFSPRASGPNFIFRD